jgi:hypothetical protein
VLTREIMGLLALWILWLNAGLVFAVALRQLGNVRALRRRVVDAMRRGELVTGTAEPTEGDRFAVRRVAQTGRAITTKGPDRILFTDGPQSFEVIGGAVRTADGSVKVASALPVLSEVWVDTARAADATGCGGAQEFDEAWKKANTSKGLTRDVDIEVRAGDRVWVMGAREEGGLVAREDAPLIVSMVDPVAFCASRARLLLLFIGVGILALVGVTVLALWSPHFGTVSTLGGVLGVAYFLGIQPLGTAVRDAVKTPARRQVGALWQRPSADASPSRAPAA